MGQRRSTEEVVRGRSTEVETESHEEDSDAGSSNALPDSGGAARRRKESSSTTQGQEREKNQKDDNDDFEWEIEVEDEDDDQPSIKIKRIDDSLLISTVVFKDVGLTSSLFLILEEEKLDILYENQYRTETRVAHTIQVKLKPDYDVDALERKIWAWAGKTM